MEVKKNPKYDLNKNSGLYFSFGLCITLFSIWMLFEKKTYEKEDLAIETQVILKEYEEEIPITITDIATPPPPPAPVEAIQIVADEIEIEETIIASTETNQKEVIGDYDIVNVEDVEYSDTIEEDIHVPFAVIEEVPIFPGCEGVSQAEMRSCFVKKIQQHIKDNFKYPLQAQELNIQGRVYVSFIIDQKGDITNIQSRAPNFILKESAENLIRSLPKMTPGKQRGKPVKVNYSLPVAFKIIT